MKVRGVESESRPLAAAREAADRRVQVSKHGIRTGIRTGTSESVSLSLFPLTPHTTSPLSLLLTRCLPLCSSGCPIRIAVPNRYRLYATRTTYRQCFCTAPFLADIEPAGLLDPRAVSLWPRSPLLVKCSAVSNIPGRSLIPSNCQITRDRRAITIAGCHS
jgi:hypothetical protein